MRETGGSEADPTGLVWDLAPYALIDGSLPEFVARLQESIGASDPDRRAIGLRCKLPPELGRGAWDAIKAADGVYVMLVNAQYASDRVVHIPGDRAFKIRVVLSGRIEHPASKVVIEGTGAYLEAYPGNVASHYTLGGGAPIKMVILNCLPEVLTQTLGIAEADIPHPIDVLSSNQPGDPQGGSAALGPDLLRAANDIMSAPAHYPAALLRPYLAAKSQEIICSVLRQLAGFRESGSKVPSMSLRDVSRTYEARDILLEQFARPPSIPRLARQVGVNQTKLKASFKAVFGLTIYDFILKCRMERARELLTDREVTIAEAAYAVGYEYPANFTHAFKRYYHQLPKQLRRARTPSSLPPSAVTAKASD